MRMPLRVARRTVLAATVATVLGLSAGRRVAPASAETAPMTPAEAFRRLLEGNNRFVAGQPPLAVRTPARRTELAQRQAPFAAVLTCADSRVAPEILFDQGLGDLYVVRTAGVVADPVTIGSLEFAIEIFALPLVVVLGHERCDAVLAAIEALQHGSLPAGQIGAVIEALRPAVQLARLRAQLAALRVPPDTEPDLPEAAVRAQVAGVVERLRRAGPVIAPRLQRDQLRVVGLRYDLETGGVEIVA